MMKSLFKGVNLRRRESSIKENLSSELLTCVKSVQFDRSKEEDTMESVGCLCTVLEAIFMHGLKETLSEKMSSLLGDPDQRPSPEFWNPLMIFSHTEMIKQVIYIIINLKRT